METGARADHLPRSIIHGRPQGGRGAVRMRRFFLCLSVTLWLLLLLSGCNRQSVPSTNRVVLYCSVDDVYARPIIKRLEAETGLRIDALYDTEATKTAGLGARLPAESRLEKRR